MTGETTISSGIRNTEAMEAYDAACKRLLSEKSILARIMKGCIEEYGDCDVAEIAEKYIEGMPQVGEVPVMPDETNMAVGTRIQGLSNEDATVMEGTVTYDIRFSALFPKTKGNVQVQINLEAQNVFYPGYPLLKRAIYYCSRMISAQYGTVFKGSHYERIRKVYSIWICTNPPKRRRNTITRYRTGEEYLVGKGTDRRKHYDLQEVTLVCLGSEKEKRYEGLLRMLGVLLKEQIGQEKKRRILQGEFGIPMTEKLESGVNWMCNLSQGVLQEGIEIGLERGIEQGLEQGLERGVARSVGALMKSMGLSMEQAMDALNVFGDQRERCAKLLIAQLSI